MATPEIVHEQPEFLDVRSPETTFADTLRLAEIRRDEYQEKRFYQEQATIRIPTEWPITVFTIGDVHYGSVYTDTDRFMRDIGMIRETPNTYIVLMSNLIDNASPSQYPDSMLANSMTPHDQAKGMHDLIAQLDGEGKILGAVKSPCHEGWLWKNGGFDINEYLFADTSFPKLDNGGLLRIQLAEATYRMALFHKFGPFGSHFNKSHPAQQMQRLVLAGEADIIALAHSHYGEAMQTYYGVGTHRRDVVYLRTGTYKGNVTGKIDNTPDMWIRDRAGTDGEPSAEAIMLRGDRREMQAFLKPETAIDFHKALYTAERLTAIGVLGKLNAILEKGQEVVIYGRKEKDRTAH